jgi:hypothetical protein
LKFDSTDLLGVWATNATKGKIEAKVQTQHRGQNVTECAGTQALVINPFGLDFIICPGA